MVLLQLGFPISLETVMYVGSELPAEGGGGVVSWCPWVGFVKLEFGSFGIFDPAHLSRAACPLSPGSDGLWWHPLG